MHGSAQDDAQAPLSEATYFILLSLSHGPRHGYAIMKNVRDLSEGRVTLSTGTLYGAIKRLLDQGWIQPVTNGASTSAEQDGRGRRAYTLTRLGRGALDGEVARLRRLLAAAKLQGAEGRA